MSLAEHFFKKKHGFFSDWIKETSLNWFLILSYLILSWLIKKIVKQFAHCFLYLQIYNRIRKTLSNYAETVVHP